MDGALIVYGEVTEVKPGYARVKLPEYDGIITDFLPVVKIRGAGDDLNWPLEIDEQVICVMTMTPDDMIDTGVILGVVNNETDTPDSDAGLKKMRFTFSDGGVLEYDKQSHKWQLAAGSGGTAELLGNSHNLVKHTPLNTELQNFKTALQLELVAIAAGIAAGGGSYSPGTLTIDISAAKVDELKCP